MGGIKCKETCDARVVGIQHDSDCGFTEKILLLWNIWHPEYLPFRRRNTRVIRWKPQMKSSDQMRISDQMSIIPNSPKRKLKRFSSSGFVNKSASWRSVPMKYISIFPFSTWSRRKWYLISICFDLEWSTGLFEMAIAFVLSQKIGVFVTDSP